jgi:hypothetical protein
VFRCPSFPYIPDGCQLATDPLDSCCRILNCVPRLQPGTNVLVPPIRGVIVGSNLPKPIGVPSVVGGPSKLLYCLHVHLRVMGGVKSSGLVEFASHQGRH